MSVINKKRNKCRTCLKVNTKMQSLTAKPKMLKIDKTYLDLLMSIAKIEVDPENESKFSQRICNTCSKKIRDSYTFIEQVHKCHHYFMTIVENCSEKLDVTSPLKEELCIHQEKNVTEGKPEDERVVSDLCSLVTNYHLDNLVKDDIDHTDALQLPEDCSPNNFTVKVEAESKSVRNELYPECVINETELDEDPAFNSDSDSSTQHSSNEGEDPLDNEPSEDNNTPASVEDEMLPVCCDECERVFANSLLLNRHKKDTHLPDELKIQCPSCPVKFSRRYNMYAHMRTFHKSETVREHQIQPRKLTKTDICDQCHRSYSDKYKLLAHIKNKHGPGSVPKKPKQPPKQYLCTLCGLTCTNKSNLEIHYRRRHTGEKPFKCDFCDRCFTRSYEVKVHRRTHTGESPYKCTECEKAFKRSNKLKIHMRIHTNERPYKCTECEKAFRESKDLNIHRRTHTGERPYKCGVCQSTFTQSNSLKLHQKKKKHFETSVQNAEFTHVINTFL